MATEGHTLLFFWYILAYATAENNEKAESLCFIRRHEIVIKRGGRSKVQGETPRGIRHQHSERVLWTGPWKSTYQGMYSMRQRRRICTAGAECRLRKPEGTIPVSGSRIQRIRTESQRIPFENKRISGTGLYAAGAVGKGKPWT